jgi:hypothetical protein
MRSQFYKTVFSKFHYMYGLKTTVKIVVKDSYFLKWCWRRGVGMSPICYCLYGFWSWSSMLKLHGMSLRDVSGTITNTERIAVNPNLLWNMENNGFVNLRFQFKMKGTLCIPSYALYRTCLAWWWTIGKDETCCTIKHILNCVNCYYMITKISICFCLYRDNDDDVN